MLHHPIECYWAKKEKEGRTKTKGIYRNNTVEFQGTKNKKVEPNALEDGKDGLPKKARKFSFGLQMPSCE